MSSNERRDRMDRTTAEQFLQGDRATLNAGHPRLAELLAAASASAHPAELAGESAAMAAFTAARHSPPSPARRPSMIQLAIAKILTIKVAAIAGIACASVGGVALAANAGVLPAPISSHLPGAHSSKSAQPHPTQSGSAQPRPIPSGSALPRPSGPAAGPLDIAALCRDFGSRGDKAHRTKALEERRFGELVRRAGKKDHDRVEKFCARLKPSGSPSARPSGSAFPDAGRPGGQPSTRPGEQSGYPSDRPSSFPRGSSGPAGPTQQG